MRIWTGLIGGLGVAAAFALTQPASAQDWCGFLDKAHAQVQCGYSSLQQCQQALSDKKDSDKKEPDKTVVCLPDPASG